jgi:hypothetical protein
MPEGFMQGILVKNLSWHHWLSGFLAIALHTAPIALIGISWESAHFAATSPPASQVIPIRLDSFAPVKNRVSVDEIHLAASQFGEVIQPSSSTSSVNQYAGDEQAGHYTLPSFYFPASELDIRPYPEAAVVIPFPDVTLQEDKAEGILVLYIDMDGNVNRIEVQDSTLPPLLEQAAMTSFMQTKMHPGMREGKAVRSQMKVLVEFESRHVY